jgi:vacuolar-type H+-ATPase subunit I/STV1
MAVFLLDGNSAIVENDFDEEKCAETKSARRKTTLLMGVLAFTATFSFGMVEYSVNTAMISFAAFVNHSLIVCLISFKLIKLIFILKNHYNYEASAITLEWFIAVLLCINMAGIGMGIYQTSNVAEKFGRKSKNIF